MANALRSEFLGKTLQRTEMSSAKAAERVQTQALFNKKATKTATKQVKQVQKKAQKAVPQLQKKVQKAVPQLQKKATQVQKSATKQVKKAASGKSTKGWFGGVGGASDLDRWYGECLNQSPFSISSTEEGIGADVFVPGRRPLSRAVPARRPAGPF
jgi:hypothetical protein